MTRMHAAPPDDPLGLDLAPGDGHYRAYVGPPADYDLVTAMCFGLLTVLGLRQHHRVLDIGCGSLRVGRVLIPYLNRGGYTGLEPNAWLVDEGIRCETGADQVSIKQPRFIHAGDADHLEAEGARFDFILAQSIFSHCAPDLLDRWVAQASRLLAPNGALVATFVEGPQDAEGSGWIYPDCVAYRRGTMADVAARHGLDAVPLEWRHPRQQWMLMARPGFDAVAFAGAGLGWNALFDRIDARRQSPGQEDTDMSGRWKSSLGAAAVALSASACNPQANVPPGQGSDAYAPVEVVDWGPRATPAGTPFNVQADGNSGLSFNLRHAAPPAGVDVLFDGQPLPGVAASGSLVTATVPAAQLASRGAHAVALRNRQTGQMTPAGSFAVE